MNSTINLSKQSRIRRGADQWQKIIQQYQKSGQTQAEFCAEQSLALSTFHRWHQQLRAVGLPHPVSQEEPVFVELSSTQDSVTMPPGKSWDVELQLGGDIVLRLRQRC